MTLKRFSFLLIIWFVYTACNLTPASINLQNGNEVRKALTATWEAEFMETSGSRNKVPENMVSEIIFNENGTYIGGVKNGVIKNEGKWSYDPTTQMLNLVKGNQNISSRILKFTTKELVCSEYTTLNDEIVDSTVVTYKKL